MPRVRELHFAAIAKTTVCCGQFAACVSSIRQRKVPTPRERAGPGRAEERAATSFSSPLSCRVQSGSQLRLLIQGGRDRGPKTKRKTFVNQDVGLSVHLAGNEIIRISIFFDLEVFSPILPFTSFSCLHSFPSCSRPSSLSDFVSSEFHMDSQRMKEPNAKGAPKRGRKEKQFLGAPKGGRRRSTRKDVRIMAFSSALPCRITATSPTMKRRKRRREGSRCHKSLSEARDGAQSVRPSAWGFLPPPPPERSAHSHFLLLLIHMSKEYRT